MSNEKLNNEEVVGNEKLNNEEVVGNEKYVFSKNILKWIKEHPLITIITLAATVTTGSVLYNIFKPKDNNNPVPDSSSVIINSDDSYESGNYVYVVINENGYYNENILKNAIKDNKKIGIIINPSTHDSFTDTIFNQIYSIIAKYKIDLPILYNVNTMSNNINKNVEIAKKLFSKFDEYSLYIGFYGDSDTMEKFIDNYGKDANKYDKMISNVDDNDQSNISGNMVMYKDGTIKIATDVVNVIEEKGFNTLTEYKIKYGDSLDSISSKYSLSIDNLSHINEMTNQNEIYAGDTILVPMIKNLNNKNLDIVKGIDVSSHQGVIDWETIKANNTQFAIIGIGDCYTSSLYENYTSDSQFVNNIKGCLENDIPFALYYYTRAKNINDANLEAKFFKGKLSKVFDLNKIPNGKIPVFIDIETDASFEPQQNIKVLNDKILTSKGNWDEGTIELTDDIRTVLDASTIIDVIYNYFPEYQKGVFNKEQIINTLSYLQEYLETGKLHYNDNDGSKKQITKYVAYSSVDENKVVSNLDINISIEAKEDGYKIIIARYRYNKNIGDLELYDEEINISKDEIHVLEDAKYILESRLNDKEFINKLENSFKPEYILKTAEDTFGDAFKFYYYGGSKTTNQISKWKEDTITWVTSHGTYYDSVSFKNWNNFDLGLIYDWADIIQYSERGVLDGVAGTIDVNYAESDILKYFVNSEDIIYVNPNIIDEYSFTDEQNYHR